MPEHVERQGYVVLEQLSIVEIPRQGHAHVQLAHQPGLIHPAKDLDAPHSRGIEHWNRWYSRFDPLARRKDPQRIHNARRADPLRAASRTGLAARTQPYRLRVQDRVRLTKLYRAYQTMGRQIKVLHDRAPRRTLLALKTQIGILATVVLDLTSQLPAIGDFHPFLRLLSGLGGVRWHLVLLRHLRQFRQREHRAILAHVLVPNIAPPALADATLHAHL